MDKRIALVTGGSRGIGKAICIELASQNIHILINYKSNKEEALKTLETIEAAGGSGEILGFDCSDKNQVESAMEMWKTQNPNQFIEILVNNAGIKKDGLMMMMPDADWDDVLNTNLNGFFYVTRRVIQKMIAKRRGRVVNVVSLSGVKGMQGQTNYAAAKAGVIGATKSLALEVARRNITVNAVAPGFIKTDMTEGIEENDYKAIIPSGRFGTPEEVASTVAFLVSAGASYITGEVININGGLHT